MFHRPRDSGKLAKFGPYLANPNFILILHNSKLYIAFSKFCLVNMVSSPPFIPVCCFLLSTWMMYCTTSIIQRYDFDFVVHFNDISCNSQIVTLNMVLELQWHRHQHRHRRRHRHHQHHLSSSRCVFVVKTCLFPTHVGSSGLTGVCWTLFSPPVFLASGNVRSLPASPQNGWMTEWGTVGLTDRLTHRLADWPTDSLRMNIELDLRGSIQQAREGKKKSYSGFRNVGIRLLKVVDSRNTWPRRMVRKQEKIKATDSWVCYYVDWCPLCLDHVILEQQNSNVTIASSFFCFLRGLPFLQLRNNGDWVIQSVSLRMDWSVRSLTGIVATYCQCGYPPHSASWLLHNTSLKCTNKSKS